MTFKGYDLYDVVETYYSGLIHEVPIIFFLTFPFLLFLLFPVLAALKGINNGLIILIRFFLFELMLIFYCSTIIFRNPRDYSSYNFCPFWSYAEIFSGKYELVIENFMNVLVFIPVGLLIGLGFSKWPWWKAVGLGCLFSISIESLQFFSKRGFCEVDDVIHNTLGCVIGYGIFKLIKFAHSAFCKAELIKKFCRYDTKMDI